MNNKIENWIWSGDAMPPFCRDVIARFENICDEKTNEYKYTYRIMVLNPQEKYENLPSNFHWVIL